MSKDRKYEKESIELCRNCKGSGVIRLYKDGPPETCFICSGHGRVIKKVKIELSIEPYTGPPEK
jgi:DnaJ-class molecular chaperone